MRVARFCNFFHSEWLSGLSKVRTNVVQINEALLYFITIVLAIGFHYTISYNKKLTVKVLTVIGVCRGEFISSSFILWDETASWWREYEGEELRSVYQHWHWLHLVASIYEPNHKRSCRSDPWVCRDPSVQPWDCR